MPKPMCQSRSYLLLTAAVATINYCTSAGRSSGHVATPASLLAFVAWQLGDGALANVALDRALADDSRYSMALLLRQVITAGAPPSLAPPSLARLPMTPEVAASYDTLEAGSDETESPEGSSKPSLTRECDPTCDT